MPVTSARRPSISSGRGALTRPSTAPRAWWSSAAGNETTYRSGAHEPAPRRPLRRNARLCACPPAVAVCYRRSQPSPAPQPARTPGARAGSPARADTGCGAPPRAVSTSSGSTPTVPPTQEDSDPSRPPARPGGPFKQTASCVASPSASKRAAPIELELPVKTRHESQAAVNAVTCLLATVQDLERARAEREERISLWPADDDPAAPGHAVVSGHMRDSWPMPQTRAPP